MATNLQRTHDARECAHDGPVLGDRSCREDPVACHLATALSNAEDDDARFHLREALQLRLVEP